MSEVKNDWFKDLKEKVEEMLANPKDVKFNTHKNRKLFTSRLMSIVKEAVDANTIPKNPTRADKPTITHPNPNGNQRGFAVMDENLSAKGDEVLGVGPNSTGTNVPAIAERMKNQHKGVRTW